MCRKEIEEGLQVSARIDGACVASTYRCVVCAVKDPETWTRNRFYIWAGDGRGGEIGLHWNGSRAISDAPTAVVLELAPGPDQECLDGHRVFRDVAALYDWVRSHWTIAARSPRPLTPQEFLERHRPRR